LLLLMGLGAAGVKAQVRIGGNGAPNAAAALDLNEDDATNTGTKTLALPRVSLASTTDLLGNASLLTGMLVYNTNTTLGVGVFFWDGSKWIPVQDSTPNGGVAGSVTGAKGTYKTWCFPASTGLGCWMTENSKEGTPAATAYPGQVAGIRGYYYAASSIYVGSSPISFPLCPPGYRLPTLYDAIRLQSYVFACPTCDGTLAFMSDNAGAGYSPDGATWANWGIAEHIWLAGIRYGTLAIEPIAVSNYMQIALETGSNLASVRCVKQDM